MTTQFITKRSSGMLFVILAGLCYGAAHAPAHAQRPEATKAKTQYQVSTLPGLGGTSNGGNSINDQSWAAGYARLPNRTGTLRYGEAVCLPTSAHLVAQTAVSHGT